jgi:NADP-dependent 3-hydroxy acid dehydrogenase YdfG
MAEQIDWSKMLGAGYFRDRTVLITGASSGIGRDIAMSLSRMGARVAMLARRKAVLDELKGQVESAGAWALALGADVTHASEVRGAVDRTLVVNYLSTRPDAGQMRVFHAEKKRILKTEDSLAERGGFEPPVPLGLL